MEEIECCENCRFSFKFQNGDKALECRRYPPVCAGHDDDGEEYYSFVYTQPHKWCGEWRNAEQP